ncbi:MAG: ABC transporter ATP-binding protein [Armatimonadota bacterium]
MIAVSDLTITYGELVAVRSVDLQVPRGSVLGLVGPNGAGKTSMMRAIMGLLVPARGQCLVGGIDVQERPQQARRLIGYMPDFFGVYEHLLVWEYLELFGQLNGVRGKALGERIDEVLALTKLGGKREAEIGGLSRGMKQRLCLARALVHQPQVLVLDEPASGVDPRGRYEIRTIIRHLGDAGTTILVSSHILPELADVCDRLCIMEKGELVAAGTVDEIAARLGSRRLLTLQILDGRAGEVPAALEGMATVMGVEVSGDRVEVSVADDPEAVAELLSRLHERWLRIGAVTERRTGLEDLFLQLTRGELA